MQIAYIQSNHALKEQIPDSYKLDTLSHHISDNPMEIMKVTRDNAPSRGEDKLEKNPADLLRLVNALSILMDPLHSADVCVEVVKLHTH
jgi:hypothetical protein